MISVDSKTMRAIDRYCIDTLKIPSIILMENAAIRVFDDVKGALNDMEGREAVIVCGTGNNGGDGLAVARHLYIYGCRINVFIVGNLQKATEDFNINLCALENMKAMDSERIAVENINPDNIESLKSALKRSNIVIDAIFGTGLRRNIEGLFKDVVECINEYGKYVVSIDAPSGISGDDGRVMGTAVKADETVTIQLYKEGFSKGEAYEYCGRVKVVDIGMPKKVINDIMQKRSR